ncbi:MAG: hypothetical protein JWM85_3222 [Acidimicrobiaceae bacterium]|nr:hypothetical protein [Acidimicrobiaceae bacterium]
MERPRDDSRERPVYSPDQVRRFLGAVGSDRLRALWQLVPYHEGSAEKNSPGLRWRDLDPAASPPLLTVRSTRTTAGNKVVEGDP